jgi:hypothetical protein
VAEDGGLKCNSMRHGFKTGVPLSGILTSKVIGDWFGNNDINLMCLSKLSFTFAKEIHEVCTTFPTI